MKATITAQGETQIAATELERLIDERLAKLTPVGTTGIRAPPQLDADELAQLPFKTYKTKQPCKPAEAGWIFRNTPGADALADLIEKQGKDVPVQIGPHKFKLRFSGAQRQFIGRAPVKK